MTTIPDEVLRSTIRGKNLSAETLGDELRARTPALLVFLRHFG